MQFKSVIDREDEWDGTEKMTMFEDTNETEILHMWYFCGDDEIMFFFC